METMPNGKSVFLRNWRDWDMLKYWYGVCIRVAYLKGTVPSNLNLPTKYVCVGKGQRSNMKQVEPTKNNTYVMRLVIVVP